MDRDAWHAAVLAVNKELDVTERPNNSNNNKSSEMRVKVTEADPT